MTRVLVPVAVLEGESVPAGLATLLETVDVTLLGYHVLPEQTPPDQARLQYEDRANEALEDIAAEFRGADHDVEHRLVFTHDREKTIDRVADEANADAFVVTGAIGAVDKMLVPLTGDVAVEEILSFVTDLVGGREVGVTLFVAADEETEAERAALEGAAAALADEGIEAETRLGVGRAPMEALVEAATDHDAVVMGERAPSLTSLVFGEEADRVAAETVGPVLVVRREAESG